MTTENPIIKSLSKVRFYHQDSRNIACHYMSIPLILVGLSFPFVLLDNVISTVFPNVSEGTVAYTIPFLYIMYFASWDLWVALASGSLVFATMFTCVTLASMQYGLVYIATCAILGTLFSLVGHSIYELRTPANDLPEFPVTVFYFALLLFFPFGYREELRDKIWKEADSHLLNFLTKDYPKKSKRILNGSGIVYYEEMKWSNWASNISLNAQMRFFPTTIEDLTTIVKLANQNNKKISLIGSGHSWSPVSTTEDYLIDIRLLRDIKVNKENCLVKIQPGVSVAELDTVLAKHGLCLPTNVILTSVKYGGIIGTGCHGAGSTIPPMGDMVISMDMINHEGQIITIDESNPELLNAARVNLGTMGIMCSITMKVLPMYNLRMIDSRLKVEDLSDTKILRKVNEEHQMYELFWFPFSKSVWLKTWDKTKDDVTLTNTQKTILDFTQFFETYFGIIFYKLITSQLLYTKTPFIVPMITRTLGKYSNMVGQCPDMVHYRRFIENGLCYNTEFAIPVDKDYENVLKAWQAIQRVIEKYQSQNLFPINLCIEMRSTKNSTAYLSPCVGEEGSHFAYVEIISYQNTKGYCDAAKDISEELMKIGARPHWAKMYQVVPEKEMNPYLRNVYGDNFNKFKKIRDQFDPKKMFVSNYMEDLFFGGDQQ